MTKNNGLMILGFLGLAYLFMRKPMTLPGSSDPYYVISKEEAASPVIDLETFPHAGEQIVSRITRNVRAENGNGRDIRITRVMFDPHHEVEKTLAIARAALNGNGKRTVTTRRNGMFDPHKALEDTLKMAQGALGN